MGQQVHAPVIHRWDNLDKLSRRRDYKGQSPIPRIRFIYGSPITPITTAANMSHKLFPENVKNRRIKEQTTNVIVNNSEIISPL